MSVWSLFAIDSITHRSGHLLVQSITTWGKKPEASYGVDAEEKQGRQAFVSSSSPPQLGERLKPCKVIKKKKAGEWLRPCMVMKRKKEKKKTFMVGAVQAHPCAVQALQNNGIILQTFSQTVMIGPTTKQYLRLMNGCRHQDPSWRYGAVHGRGESGCRTWQQHRRPPQQQKWPTWPLCYLTSQCLLHLG